MVSQVPWANAAPAIDRPAPPSGRQLGICYVAAASGERHLGDALDDLRALGHEVLAVAFDTAALGWTGDIVSLCAIDAMPALTEAVANPAGFAAALSFAQRQKAMPRRALLRAGARAAFLARLHGCAHLHASSGSAAASVAICAARIASATVSFDMHDHDAWETASVLLESANFVTAGTDAMAAALRGLAPGASVRRRPSDPRQAARALGAAAGGLHL